MRPRALALLATAVALVAVGCKTPDLSGPVVTSPDLVTPTPTPETVDPVVPGPTAEPTHIGVTDDVIRVGVIADAVAGNSVSTGSEAAWLAMRAWAQAVNSTGGLGGRDVEVVLINSNVFDHREAVQEACESDIFALVGSHAVFDGDGVDILNDESCRLPDFPAAALTPARRESPVTFVSNPTANDVWQAGPARYLSERFPEAAAAVGTVVIDLPEAFYRAQRDIEASTANGFDVTFQATAEIVDQDYDSLAAALVDAEVRALSWSADSNRLQELLGAWTRLTAELAAIEASQPPDEPEPDPADVDAPTPDGEEAGDAGDEGSDEAEEPAPEPSPPALEFVHCSADCYGPSWTAEAAELGTDLWVSISMLPFEEPGDNVELVRYVLFLREEVDENAELELIGLSSWASALLFEEAVNRAMFTSGGGLTRDLVIEAAGTITEWDARGLHGTTNPAEGIPSPCFMLVSPTPSGWIRRHPLTQGTLDCESDNLVRLVESATLGVNPSPSDRAAAGRSG